MDTEKVREVIAQVQQVILGKTSEITEIMTAFLANGHILLEDIPGVGKTTLAMAFSKAMGLKCNRVQFTPDVMPSDLTGFSIYRKERDAFVYQEGSVFCNLLLADEINRTSPKTQSALLEVMEERQVSVEGITRKVPIPFLVIATQNPLGSAGTQRLPEAQIDRFMITLSLGYPDFESELLMAKSIEEKSRVDGITPVLTPELLSAIQSEIYNVYMKDEVYRYLVTLITATRNHPYIERGASPRATIALVKMAKATAWLNGRNFVTPKDIQRQFPYIISHRIVLGANAKMGNIQKRDVINEILLSTAVPPIGAK
ncbi:MAG: AAA family ATPase [Acutalibacteraceae bacterium]